MHYILCQSTQNWRPSLHYLVLTVSIFGEGHKNLEKSPALLKFWKIGIFFSKYVAFLDDLTPYYTKIKMAMADVQFLILKLCFNQLQLTKVSFVCKSKMLKTNKKQTNKQGSIFCKQQILMIPSYTLGAAQ